MHSITAPLILLLAFLGAAACDRAGVDAPPPATNAPLPPPPSAPARAPDPPADRISLAWGSGWTLRVRPVFSGVPLKGGEGTVTVDWWAEGPASVSYAFPQMNFFAAKASIADASTGVLRPQAVSGQITVPAERARDRIFTPPAFWQGGEASAPGPLLWVPREVLSELRGKKTVSLKLAPLPNGLRMQGSPAPDPGPARLSVLESDFAILRVNGRTTRLPVLRLSDDQGATYVLLNALENPLIIQFRFSSNTVVNGKKLTTASGAGYDVVALEQ
jgi:hypothetical protein